MSEKLFEVGKVCWTSPDGQVVLINDDGSNPILIRKVGKQYAQDLILQHTIRKWSGADEQTKEILRQIFLFRGTIK